MFKINLSQMAACVEEARLAWLDGDKGPPEPIHYAELIAALEGLNVDTPFGKITYRALDHQSTMGAYVGRIAVKDGKGVMTDWRYADGGAYLPSDDWVRAQRPAN